jgi:hypothetical protein
MMCLGWYNRPTCKTRPQVQVEGAQGPSVDCTTSWFWAGLAAIGLISLAQKKN